MRRKAKKPRKKVSAEEFDKRFEANEDISDSLDWDTATKKINVDFPLWMVKALDKESARLQIPRQAVIKMWIDEKLQQIKRERYLAASKKQTAL